MKKFFSIIIIICFPSIYYGQTPPDNDSLSGFDGFQWGTSYDQVKERFRTLASTADNTEPLNIIADKPGQEILIMRKNIRYRYVFYQKPKILINKNIKDPANGAAGLEATPDQIPGTSPNPEEIPRLFFVESSFPYVPAMELESRVTEKYGKRNGGNLNEKTNRGFYLWTLTRGYLVQWIDPYKKNPYTRSLFYVSKDIIEEIRSDYPKFQYTPELKTLMDILY